MHDVGVVTERHRNVLTAAVGQLVVGEVEALDARVVAEQLAERDARVLRQPVARQIQLLQRAVEAQVVAEEVAATIPEPRVAHGKGPDAPVESGSHYQMPHRLLLAAEQDGAVEVQPAQVQVLVLERNAEHGERLVPEVHVAELCSAQRRVSPDGLNIL